LAAVIKPLGFLTDGEFKNWRFTMNIKKTEAQTTTTETTCVVLEAKQVETTSTEIYLVQARPEDSSTGSKWADNPQAACYLDSDTLQKILGALRDEILGALRNEILGALRDEILGALRIEILGALRDEKEKRILGALRDEEETRILGALRSSADGDFRIEDSTHALEVLLEDLIEEALIRIRAYIEDERDLDCAC
jgi:hypothetical protein